MNQTLRAKHTYTLRDLGVIGAAADRDFDLLVSVAARSLRAPMATFAVLDFDGGVSILRAHHGTSAPVGRADRIPLSSSLVLAAMSDGDMIVIPEIARDPVARVHPFVVSQGVRSLLAAPVMCPANEPIGLLAVHDRVARIWTAEERDTLRAAAHFGTQTILLRATLRTLGMLSVRERREA